MLGLVVLHGCSSSTYGGGTASSGSGGDCLQNGTKATIETNHGHVLVVSKQDVMDAAEKSYDIQGTADHSHSVTISEDMFATLAGDHAVMTTSSTNNSATYGTHSHAIMVACA